MVFSLIQAKTRYFFIKTKTTAGVFPLSHLFAGGAESFSSFIGKTFLENAILKAKAYSRLAQGVTLAEDSGLCVDALGGSPGIYSARFAQDEEGFGHNKDLVNNQKLLRLLEPHRHSGEPIIGQFVCVLALVRHADDPLPIIAQGIWQGEILAASQGELGFGYDPLFWVPSLGKSAAQLSKTQKNAISHRGQAMQLLLSSLTQAV